MTLTRRSFLRHLASGLLVAAAAPVVAEPFVRRVWQVGAGAPVRSLLDRHGGTTALAGSGEFLFETAREVYVGGMVAIAEDGQHVVPCRYVERPIGIVERVNDDGTAWVSMGNRFDPKRPNFEFERLAEQVEQADPHLQAIMSERIQYAVLGPTYADPTSNPVDVTVYPPQPRDGVYEFDASGDTRGANASPRWIGDLLSAVRGDSLADAMAKGHVVFGAWPPRDPA